MSRAPRLVVSPSDYEADEDSRRVLSETERAYLRRLLYGAVADFLNMSCCGFENPYAFNIADISIFAGAIGLVLFTPEKNAP